MYTMNIVIIDLETTGLDPAKHEILEIGAVKVDTGETFECKVHPLHIKEADPKALEINGYKKEDWEEAFLLPNALKLLNEFLGKDTVYLMTYNITFDWGFLREAYESTGIKAPFHYHKLDLLTLAWSKLPPGSSLSLKNVSSILGLDPEPPVHRALNGAMKAKEVYEKLI